MGPRLTLLASPQPADEENCYVESPVGVAAVLRSVAASHSRAVVYLDDEGEAFLDTAVLGLEGRDFVFEKGPDPKLNERLLTTAEMTLVTTDRTVPVQFRFTTPARTRFDDVEALRAPLPGRLLRLQRRGFYRLPGRAINAVMKCELMRGDDARKILRPVVIDLSCGGMAIDIPTADGVLADGTRHTCTIDFTGLGRIDTPLIVHSSREVTLANGKRGRRYGIEFLNLDVASVAVIQRFINDEERRLVRASRG